MVKPTVQSLKPPGSWYKRLWAYLLIDSIQFFKMCLIAIYKEFTTNPPVLHVEDMKKRTGHVAVITGGPRGLSLGLVKRLTQLDYTVIMGVRNIKDSQRRMNEFADTNPDLSFRNVKFLPLDLKSLASVIKFADRILAETSRIDLLLCNAAVMRVPYEVTEDGFESHFQVNHLSHFKLIHLLMDKMKKTGVSKGSPCKIIYTSSLLYQCGQLDFDELEKSIVYTPFKFYFASRLCQVTNVVQLEKKLRERNVPVHCYAVHPGLIPTDLWYEAGGYLVGLFGDIFNKVFRSVENGADTILWPAFCPDFEHKGGLYLESGSSIEIVNQSALSKDCQLELYVKSQELVK